MPRRSLEPQLSNAYAEPAGATTASRPRAGESEVS